MACRTCRARKIKCDRIRPVCQNCKLRSIPCTYLGERRTRQQTDAGTQRPRSANSRHQLEDVDDLQNYHASTTPDVAPPPISMSENEGRLDLWRPGQNATANQSIPSGNMPLFPGVNGAAVQGFFAQSPNDPDAAVQSPIGSRPNHPGTLLDRILRGDDAECLEVRNPALWMRATDGDEYTGPSSGISPISDLGLKWIRNHVPDSDRLCKTVQDIRDGFLSHLRQPKWKPHISLLTPRVSSNLRHIPPSRVMTYVEAYFSTVQTIFPILDQENFEAQLTLLGTDPDDELPSWKALLNAVMASGCRAALSEETAEAFQESGRESWGYFQNALSCETAIVHGATDLMAVQALAVMTIYAQGLSSPQRLEYTLCSIAYRLAQSLGLNCRPQPGWNLSEGEIQERSRVFWVIYCLDKTIALRCGRPQMIDDDEIGCCFPSAVRISRSAETSLNFAEKGRPFNFFLCFTRLSRICGTISRRLYSATALYSSSTQLLSIQNHLLENLESWRQMIPTEIQPGKPVRRNLNTLGLSRMQLVVLHSSYYYVLCAICRRFTPLFTDHEENAQRIIPPETHTIYIEAARSMVLLTKHLDVESFTPGWLAFYYPLTALIAIFVNVVSNPCSQSTHNDIALMEVIVGFFGRLEYITSGEAAFTKMTEFVRQARIVADNAASAHSNTKSQEPQRNCSPTSAPLAEDCIDAGETALVLMDAGNTQGPHTLSSQLLNNYAQPTIPSQEIESLNTYNLENVSTNYGLEIANEDPSSHLPYDDTVGLGELAHEHWLESSMPMSF